MSDPYTSLGSPGSSDDDAVHERSQLDVGLFLEQSEWITALAQRLVRDLEVAAHVIEDESFPPKNPGGG